MPLSLHRGVMPDGALIRLLATMNALMLQQVTGISKSFLAHRTFERPLSRMDQVVALQMGGLPERLIADVAGERFLARMYDGVLSQIRGIVETLLTFDTLVKFLPRRPNLEMDGAMTIKLFLRYK